MQQKNQNPPTPNDPPKAFSEATYACIMVLEDGTAEGKAIARAELMRYARELDRIAAEAGGRFDADDTPTSED
jgi:hypothetical protein